MSNKSKRKGAKILNSDNLRLSTMTLAASYTKKEGDTAYLGSDGYPAARNSAYPIIGAQVGPILDKDTLAEKATSEAGDYTMFTDPTQKHTAEIATGAITDPFTTWAAPYDIAGASGAEYINNATSVYNEIQVLGPADEVDAPGGLSAFGVNQKVVFRYTPANVMPVHSNYEPK